MTKVALFLLLGLAAFALVLALQMRWLISVSLRRALAERFGGEHTDTRYRRSVADAGRPVEHSEEAAWLNVTYPDQVGQLRLARRVSIYALPVIIALVAILRFGFEAF